MQSARKSNARPARYIWCVLPLMLGFALVRPNFFYKLLPTHSRRGGCRQGR